MVSRFPRRGIPDTFGWVPRWRHNVRGHVAWETPAGDIVLLHYSVGVLVQFLPSLAPVPEVSEVER